MCNAWNHPPGCTCPFGGVKYPNKLTFHLPVLQTQFNIASSFTNPNASCPVCGNSVYFYRSPAGGRVFFDDLGPPWPKHGCMDNSTSAGSLVRPVPAPAADCLRTDTKRPQWLDDGWSPFICSAAQQSIRGIGYYMLTGRLNNILTTLYLCTKKFRHDALLQVRSAGPNEFDVSMAWIEPATNLVKSVSLKAFTHSYLAGEWCANEAKTGRSRMAWIAGTLRVKGKRGTPQSRSSNPKGTRKQLNAANTGKPTDVREQPKQRRPAKKPEAINAIGLAFAKAKGKN